MASCYYTVWLCKTEHLFEIPVSVGVSPRNHRAITSDVVILVSYIVSMYKVRLPAYNFLKIYI